MRYENEKAPAGVAALAEAWKDDFAVNHSVPNFIIFLNFFKPVQRTA